MLHFPLSFPLSLSFSLVHTATRNTYQDSLKAISQQSTDGIATIPETTVSSSGEHSPEPSVTTGDTIRSHDHHQDHHGNMHSARSDLLKERPEIYVSTSTGDSDEESWEGANNGRSSPAPAPAPPPIPPKRGLGKMVSLPPGASSVGGSTGGGGGGGGVSAATGKRLLRGGRTSLPASTITRDLQQVRRKS